MIGPKKKKTTNPPKTLKLKGFKLTSTKTCKPEDFKAHHAKPYRRRHYLLLITSLVSTIALIVLISLLSFQNNSPKDSLKDFFSDLAKENNNQQVSKDSQINSDFGFALRYDSSLLSASAVDYKNKSIFVGPELATPRSYYQVKISPAESDLSSQVSEGSMTIDYYPENSLGASADLAKLEAQYVGAKNPNYNTSSTNLESINNIKFLRSEWTLSTSSQGSDLSIPKSSLTSFTAVLNNFPLVITINNGPAQSEQTKQAFLKSVESISPASPGSSSKIINTNSEQARFNKNNLALSLLDSLLMTRQTEAASFLNSNNPSERISLLYGSAVVKIYNFYCMDILLEGRVFIPQSCSASTGSGFLVGKEGYVGTNGHVVVNDPLSIAITYAFEQASQGNSFYFSQLAQVAGLTQADLNLGSTNRDKLNIAVNKLYKIPPAKISASNKAENILVGLNEQQPNLESVLESTKLRQEYPNTDNAKKAQLVDYNYRAIDGAQTGQFTASDVALLKLEGSESNYPSVRLGDINSLVQGSNINILGFPGAASSNPLVESTQSISTLTSGKVSSIKSAAGSNNKLIETDATIGRGNSGGPVFNDSGEVVGVATYTIDGSGDGGGVFNYIRDIADFKELTLKNNVETSLSTTQQTWESAIADIYEARYTSAVNKLKDVKALYPGHSKVDQLLALTENRVSEDTEVKQFPLLIIGVVTLVGLSLIITSILLIINHSKKHLAYKALTSAQVNPEVSTPTPTLEKE